MVRYLAKRIAVYIAMVFAATTAAYFLAVTFLRPGRQFEQQTPPLTEEQITERLRYLGLDPEKSALERYIDWLGNVLLHWDWGRSPNSSYVNAEFGARVLVSSSLTLATIVLTLIIGVALGVWTATRQYSIGDRVITGYSYFTFVVPAPVAYLVVQLGAIMINKAAGQRIFFVTGISSDGVQGFWPVLLDLAAHYAVPTFAMTVLGWAGYQVSQRQYLLDNINADFVRTARATGLTRAQAISRHALKVSFIPVAQSIAFTIPAIFTGSFFAETIFNWPGLGVWSIQAIANQDVNVAVAMTAYGAVIFAIGAILADFAIVLVDPRVRLA
ncbi:MULTISPECIES: ABC transporter permease [unclassified Brachybacterium]|uniref:ABC transporter permease n=1 Tax=unclassified Brachybacterium TaxID=2623841 RepID=UPI000C80E4DD|nr:MULTISPECIES: ABC transporter permease [unclassified Brachybacterium]PMC76663.1 ABC transporter permease [Brachybacterium sp. UMB0905]